MLPYIGLWLYLISSLFRPADWWTPVLGAPLDNYIFVLIFVGMILSGTVSRVMEVLRTCEAKVILMYFAACLISIVATGTLSNLMTFVVLYFKMFCYYVVYAAFADTPQKVKWLLFLFVTLTALVALQSYTMIETGRGWADQGMYWGGRVRWIGMYDGANVLCMLFVFAMAFVIMFVFGPWGFGWRVFGVIAGISIVNGIYLTKSRGGFLAFVVVVSLYLLLRSDAIKRIEPKKLLMPAAAFFFLMMVAPARMQSLNDAEHSSAGRIDAWQEGLEMARANPFFGVGQGNWVEHHFRLAHNSAVQTLGEAGTFGLFTLILMFYVFLRALGSIAWAPRDPEEKYLSIALLMAFGGSLVVSFFVTTTQFDLNYIFFGLTSALVLRRKAPVVVTKKDLVRVGTIEFAIVLTIYVTVRIFYGS